MRKRREHSLYLLRGYAGTGKTSLIASIVRTLVRMRYKVVLMAPTGRAAKVFASYAGMPAYTIHKKIYRRKSVEENGEESFGLGFNNSNGTLYFVDEASMISESSFDSPFGSGSLLDDLIRFIDSGKHNKLILMGDDAQLPPVGTDQSPALDKEELSASYGFKIYSATLTEIVRQSQESGILFNASVIRGLIGKRGVKGLPHLTLEGYPDIVRISGAELVEELESCYSRYGMEETLVVCRSNKRANRFNQGIRGTILYMEEELCGGDRIMVVKNNYRVARWNYETPIEPTEDGVAADEGELEFIANGESAMVLRARGYEEKYGHRFINAVIRLDDSDIELDAKLLLDTLTSEGPALSAKENRELFLRIEADYMDIKSKKRRHEAIMDDFYYNALQIKFAYAVTCHKAQGGQWDVVFVDQGYLGGETPDDSYWRWLYTAFTRARQKLYLLNFSEAFFE